jgi:hypothetical protein
MVGNRVRVTDHLQQTLVATATERQSLDTRSDFATDRS